MTTHGAKKMNADPFLISGSYPHSSDMKRRGHQYMETNTNVFVCSINPSLAVANETNRYNTQLTSSFPKQFLTCHPPRQTRPKEHMLKLQTHLLYPI